MTKLFILFLFNVADILQPQDIFCVYFGKGGTTVGAIVKEASKKIFDVVHEIDMSVATTADY